MIGLLTLDSFLKIIPRVYLPWSAFTSDILLEKFLIRFTRVEIQLIEVYRTSNFRIWEKIINFQKKTLTIFTFSKSVHTCPSWILMGKYLESMQESWQKKRPEVFEKLNLKVLRSGIFLSTFYTKVYWDNGRWLRICKFSKIFYKKFVWGYWLNFHTFWAKKGRNQFRNIE